MPHPLHEQVRRAFGFPCGYCRVDETSAGAELTVDHYRPLAAGDADELANLVYACFRCNLYKGDYWPSPKEEAACPSPKPHPDAKCLTLISYNSS